jgi:Domain of unknown function (DUF1924)
MAHIDREVSMRTSTLGSVIVTGGILGVSALASAASPLDIHRALEAEARQTSSVFSGFSAQRGLQFFRAGHGSDGSCATCHTADPRQAGRHAKTGKTIAPLAPAANPERFTDPASVDKWFKRSCNDVLGRSCTALEKGDAALKPFGV